MTIPRAFLAVAGWLTLAGLALADKPVAASSARVVGSAQELRIEPDLEGARQVAGGYSWSRTVLVPGAGFLKLHLVNVNLRAGDRILVRSHEGRIFETITRRGPRDLGTFWALSVPGDSAVIEFVFAAPYDQPPFSVDKVIVGDPGLFGAEENAGRSLCGAPDFEDVACYEGDPAKWENMQAVAGVMSVGASAENALFCTAANISPQDRMLTNNHCIDSQLKCDNSEYVFGYRRNSCNGGQGTSEWVSYRCGTFLAGQPLLSCDASPGTLDFALTTVEGEPSASFGHVEAASAVPDDGEALYIVQHPAGRPMEVSHGTDTRVDGTVLRYWNTLDTESGSSGSPVFRESDDTMIGLHHCGGCTTPSQRNRGMLMRDILPFVQDFICSQASEVVAASPEPLFEVSGNGNVVPEAGETWAFRPRVTNTSCSGSINGATGVMAVGPATQAGVVLLDPGAHFGDVPAGETVASADPVRFSIDESARCGDLIVVNMDPLVSTQGIFPGANQLVTQVGTENFDTILFEDFSGGIPTDWSVIDSGTGTGPAQTWTTSNPESRPVSLSAPFAMVDSDAHPGLMDEALVSPVVDATGFLSLKLQFHHSFRWYSQGTNEQADVDVRSSATLGGWINVANFSGGDADGTANIDLSQWAADDLQLRFRYYSAFGDWWWAIDDLSLMGSTGFECQLPDDTDNDGIADFEDNCTLEANPEQADADGDNIGNACDADIGAVQDCFVNFADLTVMDGTFFTQAGQPGFVPAADFNDDRIINFLDLIFMQERFFQAPGPSGLPNACD